MCIKHASLVLVINDPYRPFRLILAFLLAQVGTIYKRMLLWFPGGLPIISPIIGGIGGGSKKRNPRLHFWITGCILPLERYSDIEMS